MTLSSQAGDDRIIFIHTYSRVSSSMDKCMLNSLWHVTLESVARHLYNHLDNTLWDSVGGIIKYDIQAHIEDAIGKTNL